LKARLQQAETSSISTSDVAFHHLLRIEPASIWALRLSADLVDHELHHLAQAFFLETTVIPGHGDFCL
jgi:hypothetical protein